MNPEQLTPHADPIAEALASSGLQWIEELDDLARQQLLEAHDENGYRRRLVLLGAGASRDAGLPTASELDLHCLGEGLPLYKKLRSPFGNDVERIVAALQVAAGHNGLGDGFEKLGDLRSLSAVLPPRTTLASQAELELRTITDIVRSTYWLDDNDPGTQASCAYLEPLLSGQTGGSIATLNYDNALAACPNGHPVFGGFYRGVDVEVEPTHPFRVQMLPLHGFLGWQLLEDTGHGLSRVVGTDGNVNPGDLTYPYQPAIVLGATNKLRHFGPFLDLLSAFRSELFAARTVVTIGYSWRDPHINYLLRQWAAYGQLAARDRDPRDGCAQLNLFVGTGPSSGELFETASQINTHYSEGVHVRAQRGTAAEMIDELFGAEGLLAEPHIGVNRKFWCSS